MTKKEQILEESYKLFAEHGYDNTTTAMICESVGVKKPTLYYYFKSKEDVYVTLVEDFLLGSRAIRFDMNVSKKNFKKELVAYGHGFIDMMIGNVSMSKFLIELYIQSMRTEILRDEIIGLSKDFREDLNEIIMLGETFGLCRPDERESNVELLFTAFHGIEFSLSFGTELKHKKVWEDVVTRLCCKD